MPEGPEVYTQCRQLHDLLAGKVLSTAWNYDQYHEELWSGHNLVGCTVVQVNSHGKNMCFWLRDQQQQPCLLVQHLMMTGSWRRANAEPNGTVRGCWITDDIELRFYDPRHLSTYKFFPTLTAANEFIDGLGADWMTIAFNWEQSLSDQSAQLIHQQHRTKFIAHVSKSKSNICNFLMPSSQKPYAGIGNYLKSEIMFVMAFPPTLKMTEIDQSEAHLLFDIICCILVSSAHAQGVSVRDYTGINGRGGTFERWVYKQTQEPFWQQKVETCTNSNRSTYWVPSIQRRPVQPEIQQHLKNACWDRYQRSQRPNIV